MVSTYSPNLKIELIATGEQSGSWGTTTNTNLGTLLEQAIAGYVTQAVTDGAATVLTIPDGTSSNGRNYVIELTGALTAARTVEVPAVDKPYIFFNNTSGGFAVTVKVSGQTGVSIPNGKKAIVYTNSTDVIDVVTAPVSETGAQTLTNKTLTSPVLSGATVLTDNSSSAALRITQTGAGNALVVEDETNPDATPFQVNASGQVSIGTTTAAGRLNIYHDTTATVNLSGDSATAINATRYSTDTTTPNLQLRKARGTLASPTAVASGDGTGILIYNAYGGTNFRQIATIAGNVDTYTSDTNISGFLTFNTNSGGTAVTEKMRISAAGNVGIGTTSPAVLTHIQSTTATTNAVTDVLRLDSQSSGTPANGIGVGMEFAVETSAGNTEVGALIEAVVTDVTAASEDFDLRFSTMAAGAAAAERLRITSTGNVGINQTNPGSALDVKGTLRLSGSSSGYVGLAPAAAAGSTTYTLPAADGTSGQVLSTNGSGTLSWATPSGGFSNFKAFIRQSGTYTRTLTTVTVTITAHGLTSGDSVVLDFTSGTAADGTYTVTVTGANTFTVTTAASGTTSGNVTITGYNWVIPTGITKVKAFVVGGGGGGRNSYGGGGAGGASIKIVTGLTPGNTETVTVGGGGAAAAAGTTSSFGAHCSATGGGAAPASGAGGTGGAGSSGNFNIDGGDGNAGGWSWSTTGGCGSITNYYYGSGGASILGGAGSGLVSGTSGSGSATAGKANTGGGGGHNSAGGSGVVIVEW